jgi:16S rRNA (cytidine1402-2'-O)-methyltransferase
VSASFSSALTAAKDAASEQHYPQGALYVVASPIGNLADISLRALHVLTLADIVACEDTRHTQSLLRAYGIDKSSSQLLAVHQHNEAEAAHTVVQQLRSDKRVAYLSDAGTPGISDPGARLVAEVRANAMRVIPLPGASSVTTAISVAGIAEHDSSGFVFFGFLPPKSTERAKAISTLSKDPRALVLLEAPHRMEDVGQALAVLDGRLVTVCRELTKQFETITTMSCAELSPWLKADANRLRGEFALVLHPLTSTAPEGPDLRVLDLLLPHLPLKTAVKLAAEITGQARNALYELALQRKSGAPTASSDP